MTQQEPGARLGIHRNVVVGLIDDLKRRGLAERRKHPDDRRAHAVRLTDPGASSPARRAIADEPDAELLGDDETGRFPHLLHCAAARGGLRHGVHPGLQADLGTRSGALDPG
ncbi:hypothetical protein HBB16_15900 [Pseudonocardia sp. MCCB 268]|nr:hypothetical protein [Pseudonocardia cytotoxica]